MKIRLQETRSPRKHMIQGVCVEKRTEVMTFLGDGPDQMINSICPRLMS